MSRATLVLSAEMHASAVRVLVAPAARGALGPQAMPALAGGLQDRG